MSSKNNKQKPTSQKIVGETFCFNTLCKDIKLTQCAYDYYKNHLSELSDILTSNVLIAFDTNLLLNLYKMSNAERSEFLRFVDKNASRIIIPFQVQTEYMRHRVAHILAFQKQVSDLKDTAKTYANTVKKAYTTASTQFKQLAQNSLVKNDMPEVLPYIKSIKEYIEGNDSSQEFKDKVDELCEPLNKTLLSNINDLLKDCITEINDPVLNSLSKSCILPPLSDEEYSFINEKYYVLLDDFNKHKDSGEQNKRPYCFPGCGDRKKIKDGFDPTGDFIIYHELLAYMTKVDKDIFFLTRDVVKSDWVMTDNMPFNHYIVDTYRNTGRMLYIFNAEKFIPLTFKPILDEDDGADDGADSVGVDNLATTAATISNSEVEEFDIETIEDVENDEANEKSTSEPRLSYLRDIDEDRFLSELAAMETWARDNGDDYVTVYRFVYQRLRYKHFDFNTSKAVMRKLKSEGKIVLYKVTTNKNLCIKTAVHE